MNYSGEIIKRSENLREYSIFINKIEKYTSEGFNRDEAITKAIEYCMENGVLKEFLDDNSKEVRNMILTQYNMEDELRARYSDGKEEGIEKGMEKGKEEIAREMLKKGMEIELIREITKLPVETIEKLLTE